MNRHEQNRLAESLANQYPTAVVSNATATDCARITWANACKTVADHLEYYNHQRFNRELFLSKCAYFVGSNTYLE